jgi:hypothetical protein
LREKYATRDWDDRVDLLNNIARIGEDPRVAELDASTTPGGPSSTSGTSCSTKHALRLNDLPQNRRIAEVFHRNAVHVFRINAS